MKKILSLIFIFFFFTALKIEAAITVQSVGSTVVSATQISQPINVTMSGLLNLLVTLKVKALDPYITNTTDSTLQIPITKLYLNERGIEPDVYFVQLDENIIEENNLQNVPNKSIIKVEIPYEYKHFTDKKDINLVYSVVSI